MENDAQPTFTRVHVSFDPECLKRVKASAKEDRRNTSQQICLLVDEALKAREQAGAA